VSAETVEAVRRRVVEGATCVVWGGLAGAAGFPDFDGGVAVYPEGRGRFVVTDDFGAEEAREHIAPHLGAPDEIRYCFGDWTMVMRRVTDNTVDVTLTPPK